MITLEVLSSIGKMFVLLFFIYFLGEVFLFLLIEWKRERVRQSFKVCLLLRLCVLFPAQGV
jgi:hypothetical protein